MRKETMTGTDTCPSLEALRLTLTDIVFYGRRDTVETRPRLIVLNGSESVLTDAFSLFNLSRDSRGRGRTEARVRSSYVYGFRKF